MCDVKTVFARRDKAPHPDYPGPVPDDDLDPGVEPLQVGGGRPADGMLALAARLVELLAEEALG
jgi:hypothetical protein